MPAPRASMAPMSGVLTNLAISGSTIGPNPAFLNHASHAILIVPGSTATNAAQVIGTVSANSIGNGTADSGSRDGHGIRLDMRGDATATVARSRATRSATPTSRASSWSPVWTPTPTRRWVTST